VGFTPLGVNVVITDGGGGDETDAGTLQKICIASGACPDYQGIGIHDQFPIDLTAIGINYLAVGFERPFQEGNSGIADYFHTDG
jgi:hypothetical protein